VDSAGNAYVTGATISTDFPTTAGAFQTTFASTSNFNTDAFVTKLDSTGSALVYSTYLGGGSAEGGAGIAVDAGGSAYVTGRTESFDFPTTPGAFQPVEASAASDAFVTKFNPAGSALAYSTRLGGSTNDVGSSVAVDAAGNAYVVGATFSDDFPTTPAPSSHPRQRMGRLLHESQSHRLGPCLLHLPGRKWRFSGSRRRPRRGPRDRSGHCR